MLNSKEVLARTKNKQKSKTNGLRLDGLRKTLPVIDQNTSLGKLLVEISKQIKVIQEICPKEDALSGKDRHHLVRPAKERWAFVEAALSAARENDNFLPRDVSPEDLAEDLENYHVLVNICQDLAGLSQILIDKRIVLGNNLLVLANAIFKTAQSQEQRKVQNASTIVSNLKKLRGTRKKANKEVIDTISTFERY